MKTNELEVLNVYDVAFAESLGIPESEVIRMDLFQQKRLLENLYDVHKKNGAILTLENAKQLDEKYADIVYKLETEHDFDCSGDLWYFYSQSFTDFVK